MDIHTCYIYRQSFLHLTISLGKEVDMQINHKYSIDDVYCNNATGMKKLTELSHIENR